MSRRRTRRIAKPLLPGFWTWFAVALLLLGTLGMMWMAGKATFVRREAVERVVK